MAQNEFPSPPEFWADSPEHRRKIAQSVRGVLAGKLNNLKQIVLTPNATSTTLADLRITPDTLAFLIPCSSSAAVAQASVWISVAVGILTVNHDSQPATDRCFGVALIG